MSTHYVSPSLLNPFIAPCDVATNTTSLSKSHFWKQMYPVCIFSLQPEEPLLLLKMESRLSLFTIWRPERSLRLPHRHLISPPNSLVRQNRGPVHVRRFTFVRSVPGPLGREVLSCFPLCRHAPAARCGFFSLPPPRGLVVGTALRSRRRSRDSLSVFHFRPSPRNEQTQRF